MLESLGDLVAYRLLGLEAGTAPGDAIRFFVMDVARTSTRSTSGTIEYAEGGGDFYEFARNEKGLAII
jgi:hypothetical protein